MSVKIRGYPNYQITEEGNVYSLKSKKYLKKSLDGNGYYKISLCKNGKQKTFKIHRLVASHFLKNIENKICVNHKNGNKLDNSVNNLEWCTHSENIKHAYDIKLKMPRKGNQYSNKNIFWKISKKDKIFILKNMNKKTQKQIAKELNVHQSTISLTIKKLKKCG